MGLLAAIVAYFFIVFFSMKLASCEADTPFSAPPRQGWLIVVFIDRGGSFVGVRCGHGRSRRGSPSPATGIRTAVVGRNGRTFYLRGSSPPESQIGLRRTLHLCINEGPAEADLRWRWYGTCYDLCRGDEFDDYYDVIRGVGTMALREPRWRPLLELLRLTSTVNSRARIIKVRDLTKGI